MASCMIHELATESCSRNADATACKKVRYKLKANEIRRKQVLVSGLSTKAAKAFLWNEAGRVRLVPKSSFTLLNNETD